MDATTTNLLNHFEAATRLRMLPARVLRLAKRGEIPAVLLPDGEYRFDWAELQTWIDHFRTAGPLGQSDGLGPFGNGAGPMA